MELDSIKTQLKELRRCYADDTKSDDDIIYLVYNWVRRAHAVAQMLLLEGRFPELRRCLDLCHDVLEERHVNKNSGDRVVIAQTVGEDRMLMNSLLVRTGQLQRRYEEARTRSTGRDTQYYMNKLFRTGAAEGAPDKSEQSRGGRDKRPPTPPERGVLFGHRQLLNRWKMPTVLPELVTQPQLFIRADVDAFSEVRSRQMGASTKLSPSCPWSSFLSPPSPASSSSSSSLLPSLTAQDTKSKAAAMRSADVAAVVVDEAKEGTTKQLAVNVLSSYEVELPSLITESQREKSLVHDNSVKVPDIAISSALKKTENYPFPVRSLSARVKSEVLSSGEAVYHPVNNLDLHVIKAAIAIKLAKERRHRSMAVMQSLSGQTSFFAARDCLQQGSIEETEISNKGAEVEKGGIGLAEENNVQGRVSADLLLQVGPSDQSCTPFSSLTRRSSQVALLPSVIGEETFHDGAQKSTKVNKATNFNLKPEKEVLQPLYLGHSFDVETNEKCLSDGAYLFHGLSQNARKQLDEVFENYEEKNKELSALMEPMYRKAEMQLNLFKPHEQIVQLENPAVWKPKRRIPAVASFPSDLCIPFPDTASVSRSWFSISGTTTAVSATVTGTNTIPSLANVFSDGGERSLNAFAQVCTVDHRESNAQEEKLGLCKNTAGYDTLTLSEGVTFNFTDDVACDRPGFAVDTKGTFAGNVNETHTMAERRLLKIKQFPFILFPEVHEFVINSLTQQVERERQFIEHVGLLPPLPVNNAIVESPLSRINDILQSLNLQSTALELKEETKREEKCDTAADDVKNGDGVKSSKPCSINVNNNSNSCHNFMEDEKRKTFKLSLPLTLAELRSNPRWVLLDAATLGMCFPLHLATVRIQCYFRRFLARRLRRRRAAAVEEYLKILFVKEKNVIVVQQYVLSRLSYYKIVRRLLRLRYKNIKPKERETVAEKFCSEGGDSSFFSRFSLRPGILHSRPFTASLNELSRKCSERGSHKYLSKSMEQAISLTDRTPQLLRLYSTSPVSIGDPLRLLRLRQIQRNIACRVIVRAIRARLQRKLEAWEKENRSYMNYVTRRCGSVEEAFGFTKKGSISFYTTGALSRRFGVTDNASVTEDNSPDPDATSDVFPLAPERVTGDVLAAWEARAVKARSLGEFMAPLEHVELSKLQRILQEREKKRLQRRLLGELLLLGDENAQQQRCQDLLDAALLIQRCTRGYLLRCCLTMHYHTLRLQKEMGCQHPEQPFSACLTADSRRSAGVNKQKKKDGMLSLRAGAASASLESHPIPQEAAETIMKGIRRRHPMWLGLDLEARRKTVKLVIVIQAFLRASFSIDVLAERYSDVCAMAIQRNWRLLLRRRKDLKEESKRHRINAVLGMGC